jgi:hypothetical protein
MSQLFGAYNLDQAHAGWRDGRLQYTPALGTEEEEEWEQ